METEGHVFYCAVYEDIKLTNMAMSVKPNFNKIHDNDKIKLVFSNYSLIRICAKTCHDILNRRQFHLCNFLLCYMYLLKSMLIM